MRILVLGGDGYLGWPTALHLSDRGHDVGVLDNFARRSYDDEMGVQSLVPIEPLHRRVQTWREVSGKQLELFVGDLCDAEFTLSTRCAASGPTPSCTTPSSAPRRTR